MKKFIFITGGVTSSLGKGITAASIGTLLEAHSLSVSFIKLDPYINVDPGTMNPAQHGEVYVTADGAETDLDLGHYERFTSFFASKHNSCTTGQIYLSVIEKERRGDYLGSTIQVIPHITDEIKDRILKIEADIIIVEVGGTVGDIESLPFLEAIRQLRTSLGYENTMFIHVTLLPYLSSSSEIKTKPTQHSVRELSSMGIQPDMLICRTEREPTQECLKKISMFTNVSQSNIILNRDVDSVYEVPLMFKDQSVDTIILDKLDLSVEEPCLLSDWSRSFKLLESSHDAVTIAIIGKYEHSTESYKSIVESLVHAGIQNEVRVFVRYIDAESLEHASVYRNFGPEGTIHEVFGRTVGGILIPGGFGSRGIEGKILAARYAIQKNIPFLGICLGMQVAVIEYARQMGLHEANSTEFNPNTPHPVISLLEEQKEMTFAGGTMRLGQQAIAVKNNTKLSEIYHGEHTIYERHRHRYEFNNAYKNELEAGGMICSGTHVTSGLVEAVELLNHPWFVGVQFHPEFKSKFLDGHPIFNSFIEHIAR